MKHPESEHPESELAGAPVSELRPCWGANELREYWERRNPVYIPPRGDSGEGFLEKTKVRRGKEAEAVVDTSVLKKALVDDFVDEFPNVNIENIEAHIQNIEDRIDSAEKSLESGGNQPTKQIRSIIEDSIRDDRDMIARLRHGVRVTPTAPTAPTAPTSPTAALKNNYRKRTKGMRTKGKRTKGKRTKGKRTKGKRTKGKRNKKTY